MNEDRDVTVRTDLPGDTHWYDLPDDEAELEPEQEIEADLPRLPKVLERWHAAVTPQVSAALTDAAKA